MNAAYRIFAAGAEYTSTQAYFCHAKCDTLAEARAIANEMLAERLPSGRPIYKLVRIVICF